MRLIDADALDMAFTNLRFNQDMSLAHWGDRKDWCLHGHEVEQLIHDAPTIGGWISVKDRLPENVGEYLIAGQRSVTTGWYNGSEWTSMVAVTYRDDYVTHWMPLPEPPET